MDHGVILKAFIGRVCIPNMKSLYLSLLKSYDQG